MTTKFSVFQNILTWKMQVLLMYQISFDYVEYFQI